MFRFFYRPAFVNLTLGVREGEMQVRDMRNGISHSLGKKSGNMYARSTSDGDCHVVVDISSARSENPREEF